MCCALAAMAVLYAGCAPMNAARAQLWLAPAYPGRSLLGPAEAAGAVIWSHGRSVDFEDSAAPTPAYIEVLRQGGWDTFRFNRLRAGDTFENSAPALVGLVRKLKAEGYRRVALAGQSYGGFLSLLAADVSDAVDAIIVTAPAAYGDFASGNWGSNATQLYPLLAKVHHARVMAFFFRQDSFDPGGRANETRAILVAHKLPFIVVDQPRDLTSHWAAATPAFARKFGACILGFIDAARVDDGAKCRSNTF